MSDSFVLALYPFNAFAQLRKITRPRIILQREKKKGMRPRRKHKEKDMASRRQSQSLPLRKRRPPSKQCSLQWTTLCRAPSSSKVRVLLCTYHLSSRPLPPSLPLSSRSLPNPTLPFIPFPSFPFLSLLSLLFFSLYSYSHLSIFALRSLSFFYSRAFVCLHLLLAKPI